jgi:hypothetical protein
VAQLGAAFHMLLQEPGIGHQAAKLPTSSSVTTA